MIHYHSNPESLTPAASSVFQFITFMQHQLYIKEYDAQKSLLELDSRDAHTTM
jgi:hypothetical protein